MALGIRAFFEGISQDNTKYRVRIYETDYIGSALELESSGNMFQLTYQPTTNDLAAVLAPSTATIDFYIKGDSERTLINDIIQFQQSDYYVTIEQDIQNTGTYLPYWKGVIIQDQVQESDTFIGLFSLTCVDGMSKLKEIPYSFPNTVLDGDFSYSSVFDIIHKAFTQALPLELWGTDDVFLNVTANWWTNDQTYSATADPLLTQLFDIQALTEVVDKFDFSFFDFKTCFEVLEIFGKAYLCRIYMANGAFFFEQITERRNANIKRNTYKKDKTAITSGVVAITVPINQTNESARLAGNVFNRFAALKRVIVEQTPYNSVRPTSYFWPITTGTFPSSESLDFGLYGQFMNGTPIANVISQRFHIQIFFNYAAEYTFSSSDAVLYYPGVYIYKIRVVIDVNVKLADANSGTNYYWNGTSWQTTTVNILLNGADNVVYRGNTLDPPTIVNVTAVTNNLLRTINTGPLPATGRLTITTSNHRTQKLTGVGPETYSTLTSGVTLTGSGIQVNFNTKFPTTDSVRFFNIENSNANIADFEVADLGEILIGDGALQTGHIFVEDALGDYQPTTEWNYANETRNLSLAGLLTTERLGLQREVLEIYQGQIFMPQGYDKNISFESTRWAPLQYTFIAGSGIVDGEYFAIERYTVSADYGQDLGSDLSLDFSDPNTQYKMGGITIGLGAVQDVFFDDNQTIQINNSRTEKASRGKITVITMEAAGDSSLTVEDHIILAIWSGGNGTYTLNLPSLTDDIYGQQYEIIINEDFTGATQIDVTPADGDTVRGETTYTISGADGNTRFWLRATAEGWY